MMLLDEIKNIKSGRRELRSFGLTFAVVSSIVGGIMLWNGSGLYPYAFATAALFLLLAFVLPSILKPLQKVWMTLAVFLGFFVSRLILIVLFYFVLTPVSLIGRLFGKRFLETGFDPRRTSYWNMRKDDPLSKTDPTKQY